MNKIIGKYLLMAIIAILVNVPNSLFSQDVIGQMQYQGKPLELVSVSLDKLGIDPKKDSYAKAVWEAEKMGMKLCPRDSVSLQKMSSIIKLDSDAKKYMAFIATAPYTMHPNDRDMNLYIPIVVLQNDGRNSVDWYYQIVGEVQPGEDPEPFPNLSNFGPLGHLSIEEGLTPYDWIFVRPVP